MRLFHYESIDSTSTEALRLVQKGEATPFAVLADSQSAGRGQRDRTWFSPSGNIYLSIACRFPKEQVSFLPLLVALRLAQWLTPKLSVNIHIKWPNDLLLNRKKVACVLCESYWDETQDQALVVVGIGINIEHAPSLANAAYESACLRPFLLQRWTARELADDFLSFWESCELLNLEETLQEYQKIHLPRGSLWISRGDGSERYFHEGFSPEGYLILRNAATGERKILVSAQDPVI